ncbi:MAG: DUF4256 domain-containing protein [Acidobacteria bacterium]|nr:DUF4256 domain-containing protein [Acidobacteriota bacterium]
MKTTTEHGQLLEILRARFEKNTKRHPGIPWEHVETRLRAHPEKLRCLHEMEQTGGEPDVVGPPDDSGAFLFIDCAAESPAGRRSLCYDEAALEARRQNKPAGSALGMAAAMGVDILTEARYRELQKLGAFDTKTSSWIKTPEPVRNLGGALFCDRRYDAVFVYHNGAESYYAARGFRAAVKV